MRLGTTVQKIVPASEVLRLLLGYLSFYLYYLWLVSNSCFGCTLLGFSIGDLWLCTTFPLPEGRRFLFDIRMVLFTLS